MSHELVWGAADWVWVAAGCAAVLAALLVWGYRRAPSSPATRAVAAALKGVGIAVLAICLLEPLFSGTRVRPGANVFVVLADNSQSMTLRGGAGEQSRDEQLKALLADKTPWSVKLGELFDVRRYAFDSQLRGLPDFNHLALDGGASALAGSIERLLRRYEGRPLAGILLFSDGNATDAEAIQQAMAAVDDGKAGASPPIFPVLIGDDTAAKDVSLARVSVTQSNFEDAPVTLAAQIDAAGYAGKTIVAQLLDESGKKVDQQKVDVQDEGEPVAVRFQVKPPRAGLSFYRVRVAAMGEERQFDEPESAAEATLANNSRLVAVDRGEGPYLILYVCGRPNWEYKFLNRAIQEDDQVHLFGLLRIAKREPKFDYRGRVGETTNPLYRGFDPKDKEQIEQHDQPVLVRMIPEGHDETELRDGFPKSPEELYRYHAVILDDVEAEFFTQDQMLLIKDFVRKRGGGLLMLGGQESFKNGKFDRTPIGDLLPVYLDEAPAPPADARYTLSLTKEGWLAPWVRLRGEETAERQRLRAMSKFHTLNRVRGVKPGATVLVTAAADDEPPVPALVEQRFGQGRVGALLLGDLWRWGLRRPSTADEDLEKAWRQTVRWLVGDVPKRVGVTVKRDASDDALGAPVTLAVEARDAAYEPLENATVALRVTAPDGKPLDLTADASDQLAGSYVASYVPRQAGAYRVEATVTAADGSEVGRLQTGWTSDPAADEFRALRPNRELLESIAARTGGEVVAADNLERFVARLPTRAAPITEPYVSPFWHQPWVFLLAIACLTAEWGLRRWKGLP